MLDSELINDRLLFLRRLRELTAVEQQFADQQRAWILLLEEENRATIERIATCKIPRVFETELTFNAPKALRRHRTN
jgi:hypothetical protein